MSDLKQTKGSFKLTGIVVGLQGSNAYGEGLVQRGVNTGCPYRKLRFGVKTSKVNIIYIELYGAEAHVVHPYRRKKGGGGDSIEISWDQRYNPPAGYKTIGVDMNIDDKRQMLVEYDAIEYIYNNLKDGDSIRATGEVEWQEYINSIGEEVVSSKYKTRAIYMQKEPVDFDAEDFEEEAAFDQDIVVTDTMADKETNRLVVNAYIITHNNYIPAQFYIYNNSDNKALIQHFKKMKFGEVIKIYGEFKCLEIIETEDGEVIGKKPKGFDEEKTRIGNDVDLIVVGAKEMPQEGKIKYDEKDFYDKDKEFAADDDDDDDDWGDGDTKDDTDDDLPF